MLTFDEFLTIPPCTTGKHSTVDDTPAPPKPPAPSEAELTPLPAPVPRLPVPQTASPRASANASPAPPESESDDPSLTIPDGQTCRRRGCDAKYSASKSRDDERCVHHPGHPIFHEGTKGYTCCKRRVLEFDEFMRLEGCSTKNRHLFIGSGKRRKPNEEKLESVRHDYYQTPSTVIASLFLKKIDKEKSTVEFASANEIKLDLSTSDGKHYQDTLPLYGSIDPAKSSFKIMGTKLELTLVKTDGLGWPVLRSDEKSTGEIIQSGRAGRV